MTAQFGKSAREPVGDGDDPLSAFDRPFHPFRLTAAMILAIAVPTLCFSDRAAIAAPLWRSVYLAAMAGLPLAAAYTPVLGALTGGPLKKASWVTRLGVAGYAVLIAAATMLEINMVCDRSAPQAQAFSVLAKRVVAGEGGGDHGVDVEIAAPRVWPWNFAGEPSREYVWVFDADFQRIVPGKSVILLDIHPFALGLPWYCRYRYVLR